MLWIVYGVLLGAAPVIVANVIVASLALWSSWSRPQNGAGALEPSADR